MKAIVIAAGKGSRMGGLTEETPKCLLKVNGKTILQHQIEAYRGNGVKDISVIKGFCKDKINVPGLKYFINDDYENNNILNSLMCAEEAMSGNFLASYSDILFDPQVVTKLLDAKDDITIVVDEDWQVNYSGRHEHPIEEAEKVIFHEDRSVVEIGKFLSGNSSISGEFIGLMKCSVRGAEIFRQYFHQAQKEFGGQPFIKAKTFQKAYITDLLQYMVNKGITVKCLTIQGGWHEIDVAADYEKAQNF